MPERPELPADLVLFADALLSEWAETMSGQFGELAELLRTPKGVRSVPSDRVRFSTVGVASANAAQLIGRQLDRARITLRNTGTVVVYLGGPEVSSGLDASRFALAVGDALTIDTRGEIHAIAASATGQVALIVEEYDT